MPDTPEAVLKPCPFCGNDGHSVFRSGRIPFVECRECGIEQVGDTEAGAIAAWNTRQPTGNPYIDLDVGSITVPIGYVRKMVEAMRAMGGDYQTSKQHHPDHVLVRRVDFEAVIAALALGQSVITAFDQEAERG